MVNKDYQYSTVQVGCSLIKYRSTQIDLITLDSSDSFCWLCVCLSVCVCP